MTVTTLSVVSVLYLFTALGYYRNAQYGMAGAFFAYALANLGFILEALR